MSDLPADAIVFPSYSGARTAQQTSMVLVFADDRLPVVRWLGCGEELGDSDAIALAAAVGRYQGSPLLIEHSRGSFARPGLRGHRIEVEPAAPGLRTGRDWSSAFRTTGFLVTDDRLTIDARDAAAQLDLRIEVEALTGGALRARHTLTNKGTDPYVLEGLEVTFPLPDTATEILDFTGRHERERVPQRHAMTDGLWLRESRRGKPGVESPSMLVAGPAGFGFGSGAVVAVHAAWSGNSVLRAERDSMDAATIGAGELLLPGEVTLHTDESYRTPWVFVIAARDGLDSVAAAAHTWLRSLPAHPPSQPVNLNVWEAVYFNHDLDRLLDLADLAARVGVERFVLDDGWFHSRRDDTAGLGDWWVDKAVWPDGLRPLIDRVHQLGMEFGLWFEPEMVNPDSDLYRAHPDWILSTGDRVPLLHRNQLVLDLTNPDVWNYLLERLDAVLTEQDVDAVKWDHNRDLLDAGAAAGVPAVHEQTLAHYALLAELRARHPRIQWESCAAGGGRIDLRILEQVQRVWTSDLTDALSRQQIQRWTGQFVAPEYLGAHISAPTSHQTGRTFSLDFRAATALFGAFGIEWDLTEATETELTDLADWAARYKRLRPLLHSGRVIRSESSDPAVLVHGVVATDRRSALVAHVQLTESGHNRGVMVRIPGLDADRSYHLRWEGPIDTHHLSRAQPLDAAGPTAGVPVTGRILATTGVWLPRRRPETITLIHLSG